MLWVEFFYILIAQLLKKYCYIKGKVVESRKTSTVTPVTKGQSRLGPGSMEAVVRMTEFWRKNASSARTILKKTIVDWGCCQIGKISLFGRVSLIRSRSSPEPGVWSGFRFPFNWTFPFWTTACKQTMWLMISSVTGQE